MQHQKKANLTGGVQVMMICRTALSLVLFWAHWWVSLHPVFWAQMAIANSWSMCEAHGACTQSPWIPVTLAISLYLLCSQAKGDLKGLSDFLKALNGYMNAAWFGAFSTITKPHLCHTAHSWLCLAFTAAEHLQWLPQKSAEGLSVSSLLAKGGLPRGAGPSLRTYIDL